MAEVSRGIHDRRKTEGVSFYCAVLFFPVGSVTSNAAHYFYSTFKQPKEESSSQLQRTYVFDLDQAAVGGDRPKSERRMHKTASVRYKIDQSGRRLSVIEVRF
jgi:hypothetical protein